MSLTLFSTVFEVGFHRRDVPVPPVRPKAPSGVGPASGNPAGEITADVVATGPSRAETVFDPSSEKSGPIHARTRYAIDLDSHEVIIQVVDPETQEEIRQIPTEEHRELAHRIEQYQNLAFER